MRFRTRTPKSYRLRDPIHWDIIAEWGRFLGIKDDDLRRQIRAVRSGEFRPPRAGEWYLSGAIPEAYQAKADYREAFHILRLVRVVVVEVEQVQELPLGREVRRAS